MGTEELKVIGILVGITISCLLLLFIVIKQRGSGGNYK